MAKRKHRSSNLDLVYVNDAIEQPVELGRKKSFSLHDLLHLKPITEPQSEFFEAYFRNKTPVISQIGSAGTGKTAVALYAALHDVLDNTTEFDRVIIIRSAVQTREVGFLPGDEEKKKEQFEAPYVDLCDELLKYKTNNYKNLKNLELVKFEISSFMRGKTWKNAVIIVDECQSMTYHELSTCITRVGEGSRIIFCGDTKQNDLTRRGDVTGLPKFLGVLNKMSDGYHEQILYKPQHIVRSGIAREFLLTEERVESAA